MVVWVGAWLVGWLEAGGDGMGTDALLCLFDSPPRSTTPERAPSLSLRTPHNPLHTHTHTHTHREYVAQGLDKREVSFEVDDKVLSA